MIPLVSIIVPVYNASKYIDKTINSILRQTYSNIELILVDDGSTDESLQICYKYSLKDSRVRVFTQKNSGPSAARNLGIDMARGDFLNFMDSDDWIEPDYIESFKVDGNNHSADIVFCGILKDYGEKGTETLGLPILNVKDNAEIAAFVFKIHKRSMLGWVCNKIYRTAIIREHQLRYDIHIRIREDQLFTLAFMAFAKVAVSENFCKYHYVVHEDSLMNRKKNYITYQQVAKLVLLAFLNLNGSKEMQEYVHNSYLKEYLVGIGAVRKSKEYSLEQKICFLKECVDYVKNTKGIKFRFSDNILVDLVKRILFCYAPFGIIKNIMK